MDTIAAISTPMGEGAIAIVRLSGFEALSIADKVYKGPRGKTLHSVESHTINYGHIVDPETDKVVFRIINIYFDMRQCFKQLRPQSLD